MLTLFAAVLSGISTAFFDGSFDKTAAPAGGIVTSDTRTVTIAGGGSRTLSMRSFNMTGTVTPRHSVNGGGVTVFAENDSVTLNHGDTLAFSIANATASESLQFILRDDVTLGTIELIDIVAS